VADRGATDGVRVGGGDGKAEHAGADVATVVVAEVAVELRDAEPQGREASAEGIEEMLAGKHRCEGKLEGAVERVVGGDEQGLTAVLDRRGDVEVDDPLTMAVRHEGVDEIFGDAVSGHEGTLAGPGCSWTTPERASRAERGGPRLTTVLRCVANWSISPSLRRGGEADLEAAHFAEPTFSSGFVDPGVQVVADLEEAGPGGRVGPQQRAANTGVLVDAGRGVGAAAGAEREFAVELLSRLGRQVLVPWPVFTEVDLLLHARGHGSAARAFAAALHSGVHQLVAPTGDELATAIELAERYPDSGVDLPDLVVMATSHHRKAAVLTWDFRHFRSVVLRRGHHWRLVVAEHELPAP
jgi:predicted nucleic acid-binding protein